ncbi:MAG: restriction endonuclease [Vicinamibacterales bacterium]
MTPPNTIRTIDMNLVDRLFGMGGGYVLDFTDRTFRAFLVEELGIDIDEPKYSQEGSSKAKRLRYFLKSCGPDLRVKTLCALWDYRETNRRRSGDEESVPNAETEFWAMVERLGGSRPRAKASPPVAPAAAAISLSLSHALRDKLLAVSRRDPQARGFAYEGFLRELFDAHGLAPRASFRLIGEQIDGSFELSGETYLLEAKWQGLPTGAADLRAFNAKVEDKAAWSRGLFVSNSGFTEDGLAAFGRGKRVICMDGLDIHDLLHRQLSFAEVMAKKVRFAAENGTPFIRVRDLFV